MRPFVSVIIPTWNGKEHLERCLPSLAEQSYDPFEIIVVDNGSDDGTVDWLGKQWSQVRQVALPENRGFTGGINAGLAEARGDWIALLNNDTEAEPTWLAEAIAAAERHPEAGMVATKLKLWDERDRLHAAGDFYTMSGRPGNRGVWQLDGPAYSREEWVFAPCAGAALYTRELFERVGPFDERFGSYLEDIDLAWRAQLAGFRCIYAPRAVVYHRVSATGGGALGSYFNGRNWFYVLVKNVPRSIILRHWPAMVQEQARISAEALCAWRGEAARARLRGQLAGLLSIPRLLRWRREVQALRHPAVSDADLEAMLETQYPSTDDGSAPG